MTVTFISQDPIVCNTMAEMSGLLSTFSLPDLTSCTVLEGATGVELYRLRLGSWQRTYPDQPTIDWLQSNTDAIAAMQTTLASLGSPSWASITGKPSFATVATSGNYNDLTNKPTIPAAATRSGLGFVAPATKIADSATNAATDAATNAPANAKTDYNVLTTLLGAVVDGLNQTNTNQNSIANIVNANATKQNAGFAILNTLAGRFNLSLDILENNGLMAA